MKWKITHYSIFIAFLCYNFPQNLEFCLDKVKFMFFSQKTRNLWDFMLLKKSPLEKSWSPLDPKNRHGGDKSPHLVTLATCCCDLGRVVRCKHHESEHFLKMNATFVQEKIAIIFAAKRFWTREAFQIIVSIFKLHLTSRETCAFGSGHSWHCEDEVKLGSYQINTWLNPIFTLHNSRKYGRYFDWKVTCFKQKW